MYRVSNFIRSETRLGCGGGYTRGNPLLAFNSSAKEMHRRPLRGLACRGTQVSFYFHCCHMHVLEGDGESIDDFLPPELNIKHQSNWHAVEECSTVAGLPIGHTNKMRRWLKIRDMWPQEAFTIPISAGLWFLWTLLGLGKKKLPILCKSAEFWKKILCSF